MKGLSFLFLIGFLSISSVSTALSYEIRSIGNIPLNDKIAAISINPSTGMAATISSESRTLYLINTNSSAVIREVSLDISPSAVTIDIEKNTPL